MRAPTIDTNALAPPPLLWRKPIWLWAGLAVAISVAWPALFLRSEGGLAQFVAITAGAAFALALIALSIAYALKRPPRLRRHVVIYMIVSTVICALVSPLVFVALLGALAQAEYGGAAALEIGSGLEIAGLSANMAWALAPLALAAGAPTSVIAGLALAFLGFVKRKPPPVDTALPVRQLEEAAPARALDVDG